MTSESLPGFRRNTCPDSLGIAARIRPFYAGQEDQLGALGVLLNAIVVWNIRYTHAALLDLERDGFRLDPDDVAHLTPLGYEHINVIGRYRFELTSPPDGTLRPLRDAEAPRLRRWSAGEQRGWTVASLAPREDREGS